MNIHFIRATEDHSQHLFEWRNDELTRSQSFSNDVIPFEKHQVWLKESLDNPYREIYLAYVGETPIGMIRRDHQVTGWILSWMVNPSARGQGYGKKLLASFVQEFPAFYTAQIKESNFASQKMTANAGFEKQDNGDGFQNWTYRPAQG